ncbi:MAG: hypothetical protein KKC46_19890 [Proteobacteria bacterium]|nr:hypothetical protein [Pseudomonadota bacterium]
MSKYSLNPNLCKYIDKRYIFRFYTTDRLIDALENIEYKEGIVTFWLCGTFDIAILDILNCEPAIQFLLSDKKHYLEEALIFIAEKFYMFNGVEIGNKAINDSTIDIESHLCGIYSALACDQQLEENHEYLKRNYLIENIAINNSEKLRRAFILIGSYSRSEKDAEKLVSDVLTKLDKNKIIINFIQGSSIKGVNYLIEVLSESSFRDEFIWSLHDYAKINNLQIKTTTLISLKTFNSDYYKGIILPRVSPKAYEALSFVPQIKGICDRIPMKIKLVEDIYANYKECAGVINDKSFYEVYEKAAKQVLSSIVTEKLIDNTAYYIRCAEKLVPIVSSAILANYGGIENWDVMLSDLSIRVSKNPLTLGKVRRIFEEWVKNGRNEFFNNEDVDNLNVINLTRNNLVHSSEENMIDFEAFINGFKRLSQFVLKNFKQLLFMSRTSGVKPYKIEQVQNPTLEALAIQILNANMFEVDEAEYYTGKDRADITFALARLFGQRQIKIIDIGCGKGALLYGLSDLPKEQLRTIDYIGINHKKVYPIKKMIEDLGFENKVHSSEILAMHEVYTKKFDADYAFIIDVMHEIPLHDLHMFISFILNSIKINGSIEITETMKESEEDYIEYRPEDFRFLFNDVKNLETNATERIIYSFGNKVPCTICSLRKSGEIEDIDWSSICIKLYNDKIEKINKLIADLTKSQLQDDVERKAQLIMQQNYLFKQLHFIKS